MTLEELKAKWEELKSLANQHLDEDESEFFEHVSNDCEEQIDAIDDDDSDDEDD